MENVVNAKLVLQDYFIHVEAEQQSMFNSRKPKFRIL